MLNQKQGFHIASGHMVLGHTIGGNPRHLASVSMGDDLSLDDVAQAMDDQLDPLEALINEEECVSVSEGSDSVVLLFERKKQTFPASGKDDQSGRIATNFVELAELSIKSMHLRTRGIFPIKAKHKTYYGGIHF